MDMTGTTVSAYNDLFGNEVYVECGRCGLATGTGSSGPTLAEVVEAAEHDCAPPRAYVVNDGSGSYGPEDGT